MSENYIVINGKRAELTEEQLKKLGIELFENKRWRGEMYDIYYYLDIFNQVCTSTEYNSIEDNFLYYSHNYFKTKEDAEKYARVLETEMLLRKYADEHNDDKMKWDGRYDHYFIYFNSNTGKVDTNTYCYYTQQPRVVYFSSKETAKSAIKQIGEKRIEEYLTYEW